MIREYDCEGKTSIADWIAVASLFGIISLCGLSSQTMTQMEISTGMFFGLLMILAAWVVVLYVIFIVLKVDSPDDSSEHKEAGAE